MKPNQFNSGRPKRNSAFIRLLAVFYIFLFTSLLVFGISFYQSYRDLNLRHNAVLKVADGSLDRNDGTVMLPVSDNTYRFFIISGAVILILLAATFWFVFYHFNRRLKAENQLIASENRFHTLLDSTRDLAIFMTDANGFILDWYKGAHNIKGYDKEEVIGKNISIFYTPESIAAGEPQHNLRIAAAEGSFETEGWRIRKDGSRFWADVLINPFYDEEKNLQGFTKVTRDFSVHKRAQDDSRQALEKEKELNEMKSNFVSIASHEFRTPLTTILSSVSLLEHYNTPETQPKRERHIFLIKSAVREMMAILEEFLSLEKIEEGKSHVKNELLNLHEMAQRAVEKFNGALRSGQQIDYSHNGKSEINGDGGVINQILNNLLSNAIKYSPEHTRIVFETSTDETTITISVQDQGIGISADDQKHLFERFFRASNSGNIKGTGLGLHIVKRSIDLVGGTIEVESEIGKGTRFKISLPILPDLMPM